MIKNFLKSVLGLLTCPPRISRINFLARFLFWFFAVPCITVQTVKVGSILFGIEFEWISVIGGLLIIIGNLNAFIARLHDINKSGWYVLLLFIPCVHLAILIYAFFFAGTKGPNRFGDEPLKSNIRPNITTENTTIALS